MKSILFALSVSIALLCAGYAQQPAPPKKPPVGIPADSKFLNGKWYHVYFEKGGWRRARDRCKTLGGQLAVIPDENTQTFISKLADSTALWVGATDEKVKNVWVWSDGTQMTFKAWDTERGQPDGSGKEHYLLFWKNGKWHDAVERGDEQTAGFICEWKDK